MIHEALEAHQLTPRHGVELDAGHHRDQILAMHFQRGDLGDHPPLPEDGDPIGQGEDELQVVGDEQHRRSRIASFPDQRLYTTGLSHPERGGRFVQDEKARVCEQGPPERHHLSLPTRQRPNGGVEGQLLRADAPQGGRGFLPHPPLRAEPATALAAEEDVRDDVEVVTEALVLPHDLHGGVANLIGAGRHRRAAQSDLAVFRLEHSGDAGHHGRLARSVLADERHGLTGAHTKIHAAENGERAEALREPDDLKQRMGGAPPLPIRLALPRHVRPHQPPSRPEPPPLLTLC